MNKGQPRLRGFRDRPGGRDLRTEVRPITDVDDRAVGERSSIEQNGPELSRLYGSKRYLPVLWIGQVCSFRVLRSQQPRFALFYKDVCFFQTRLAENFRCFSCLGPNFYIPAKLRRNEIPFSVFPLKDRPSRGKASKWISYALRKYGEVCTNGDGNYLGVWNAPKPQKPQKQQLCSYRYGVIFVIYGLVRVG